MAYDHKVRTYRLSSRTVQRLDQLSEELELWPSAIVDALLTQGLDDIAAGRLQITRRAVKYELSALERK